MTKLRTSQQAFLELRTLPTQESTRGDRLYYGDLNGICSIVQLFGFGGEIATNFERPTKYTEEEVTDKEGYLNEAIKGLPENFNAVSFFKLAAVQAVVTDRQPAGVEFCRWVGMTEIGPITYPKYAHKVSVFVMPLREYLNSLLNKYRSNN